MAEAATDTGSRGPRRIVAAVALCVMVLAGLATWVFMVPVTIDHPEWRGGGSSLRCDTVSSVDIAGFRPEVERLCDDAETSRRNTALIIGGIAVTVAFGASTWPSRRLTGEELGPIR